jgi:GTPase
MQRAGKNVHKVLKACVDTAAQHAKRVTTATLNLVVTEATAWKAPPSIRGTNKVPRIYYATQAAIRPPTFIFFCNDGRLIGDDYKRYIERALRESIDFDGTPLRVFFRGRAGSGDQRSVQAGEQPARRKAAGAGAR